MINTTGGFAGLVNSILNIFNVILPALAAVALVLFFYGIIQYIYSEGKKNGSVILWSLLALFILFSIWGILRILQNTLLGGSGQTSSYSGNTGGTAGNLPPIY